jgi:hypothetical protein
MKISNFKKRKGISVIYVVIITSVVLAIALGISSISAQQMKTMNEIGYSFVAFYAADSGAERQLYDMFKSAYRLIGVQVLPSGAFFSVNVECSKDYTYDECNTNLGKAPDPDCLANNYCLDSVGTYKEIKRALELKY